MYLKGRSENSYSSLPLILSIKWAPSIEKNKIWKCLFFLRLFFTQWWENNQIDSLFSILCHTGWSSSRNNRAFRTCSSQYFFSQRPLNQTHPGWVSASYSSPKQKCLPDIPTAGRQFTMSQLENDSLYWVLNNVGVGVGCGWVGCGGWEWVRDEE